MYKKSVSVLLAATALIFTANVYGEVRAFPGAEGWGAYALGGRGGDVYHVTNLNDTGAGSLRYGITSAGGTSSTPRTIVFDVSGTIHLASTLSVNKSYITIAGQTAPGDGICLRDRRLGISASHIIVRYLRCRLGDESLTEDDAISISSGSNIIMDHMSASWSVDEVFSCSTSQPSLTNVTVQWSIISEALWHSVHDKGTHSYGALIRGCYDAKYTYHHNLFAHNYSRNPRPGNYDSTVSDGNPYWEDPCGL
ncbi:MAG: pectate lyase, partial [Phycisphaerae bacterium]|nr:pectate lyase [Phycisphaerae bacterium]